MPYCDSCGREIENTCHCLSKKRIGKVETMLIFLYLMIAPVSIMTFAYKAYQGLRFPFMAYGAISLAVLLVILSLLNVIFKKSYLALFFGCHQKRDRSFKFYKSVFPICARCTGIYVGIFVSIILGFYIDFYFYYLLLMIPLIVDGYIQKKTAYRSNQFKRFTTGLLFSSGFSLIFAFYHYLILYLAVWLRTI